MGNGEPVDGGGAGEEPRAPRRVERALRDIVPVTLVAGAAAVAVAVAVGGSASYLPTPFGRGADRRGAATSAAATPAVADSGKVTVRLGPKANRTQPAAELRLGPDFVVASFTPDGQGAGAAAQPLIFAPTGVALPATAREAGSPLVADPSVVPELVLTAPVPAEVPTPEAVAVVVAPALQEAQALARPRPSKSAKAGRREVDADSEPLVARAASLKSITSLTKTPADAVAQPAPGQVADQDQRDGNGKDKNTGKDTGNPADEDRPAKGHKGS